MYSRTLKFDSSMSESMIEENVANCKWAGVMERCG